MRIGVLTQPLNVNYGGLLQAYALQTILKRMGHEVWTEDRREYWSVLLPMKYNGFIRCILEKTPIMQVKPSWKESLIISQHTDRFIKENITTTPPIYGTSKKRFKPYCFEAYIVGSDQVWRPCYSYGIYNYFLDFTKNKKVKRLAYAASFGTDEWEFSERQTKKCKSLLHKFDAISVREESAIELCEKYFDSKAIHVLDPTMLLDKEDYCRLVEADNIPPCEGDVMAYIIDSSEDKNMVVKKIADELNITPFCVMPKSKFRDKGERPIEDCVFPPVTQWLRGFMDAKYVVTDSFHGCIFSMIFEKPFIAIINKERGATRFTSLLKMFNLSDRAIYSDLEVTSELINQVIDWGSVRSIKERGVKEGLEFLMKNLSNK